MRHYGLLTLLVIFSSHTWGGTDQEVRLYMINQAEENAALMAQAMAAGDYEKVVAYMPQEFIELSGGAPKVVLQLKTSADKVGKTTVGNVTEVSWQKGEALAIVPIVQQVLNGGHTGVAHTYYIAFSPDEGATWVFVAGSDPTRAIYEKKYPTLTSKLKFPKNRIVIQVPGKSPLESVEVDGQYMPVGAFRDSVIRAGKKLESGKTKRRSGPEFSMPGWKKTISQIKEIYPGGESVRISSDETHYNVIVRAFGETNILATFCFRKGSYLKFLSLEFFDNEGKADLSTGDYTRLSIEDARSKHKAIAKRLTEKYGKATHISGKVDSGSLMVFGRHQVEFVRLGMTLIGNRANLVLHSASREKNFSETAFDETIVSGLWKNPRTDWGAESFFDVKWGMGPGDVRVHYPNLSDSVTSSPDDVLQEYESDSSVEGNVGINFEFFRGRLTALKIAPNFYSVMEHPEGEDAREEMWRRWEFWRIKIVSILGDKYGKPKAENVDFLFSSGDESSDPNVQQWETGTTLIRAFKGPAALRMLWYQEIRTLNRIENEKAELERQEKVKVGRRF